MLILINFTGPGRRQVPINSSIFEVLIPENSNYQGRLYILN